MAIVNNIVGIKIWLKRKGYHNNTSDQLLRAFKTTTKNSIKPIQSYSYRNNNDDTFEKFALWFDGTKKSYPELFIELQNNNGNIQKLKEIRVELQNRILK